MAENKSTLELVFKVNDQGSVVIDTITKKMGTMEKGVKSMSSSLSLIKFDSLINLGARAMSVASQLEHFFSVGAKAKQVEDSFNMIAEASGVAGQKLIRDMKAASGVFVDETGIMVKAQRLLLEGLKPDQIVRLTEASRLTARIMGIDVAEAFNLVTDAVISLRTKGLAQAFPTIKESDDLFKNLAESVGATSEELTLMGKRIAIMDEIFRVHDERLKKTGALTENTSEQLQKARSAWDELYGAMSVFANDSGKKLTEIGMDLGIAIAEWQDKLDKFYKWMQSKSPLGAKQAGAVGGVAISGAAATPAIEYPSEKRFVDMWKNTKESTQEVVNSVIRLENAFKELGVTSQANLTKMAQRAYDNMKTVEDAFKKGKATVADYVRAIQAASKAMEKLTPTNLAKEDEKRVKSLVDAYNQLEEQIKSVGADDPDRQKKINAFIASWSGVRSQIMENFEKIKKEVKIPIDADIEPAKETVRKFAEELEKQGIKIKIIADKQEGTEGINVWGIPAADFFSQGVTGEASIGFFGIGSSKKPISEKIQEIISQFGGLDKALSGMRAEINVAEYGMEYNRLKTKLEKEKRFLAEISNFPSGALKWNQTYEAIGPTYAAMFKDIQEQMKIIRMKMDYELLASFGGSMQQGGVVPFTGLYKLHKGEVVSNNVTVGGINITVSGARDAKAIADDLIRILKYKLSGELRGLM